MLSAANSAVNSYADDSGILNRQDLAILANVEQSLHQALQLKQWWEQNNSENCFTEQFNLIRSFNHPARGTGFFDTAFLDGKYLPLMGVVQEMLYDRADTGAERVLPVIRNELQEFVLRYFMRISDFRQPQAAIQSDVARSAFDQSTFSWCSRSQPQWRGFGYSQHYYKLSGSGRIGKFPDSERHAIVDLRELGRTYEWIVAKVRIFDFDLKFAPGGAGFPSISIPLNSDTYLILNQHFITNSTDSNRPPTGEYGFGYGMLRLNENKSLLAYGPGHFGDGFQTFNFRLLAGGEIEVRTVFVVNRPERILNVPIDPLQWGISLMNLGSMGMASQIFPRLGELLNDTSFSTSSFDPLLTYVRLINLLTGGAAAEQLCISKVQLEKEMLVQHFMEHYNMLTGSLFTWRQIPDWLDQSALPLWVIHGESA